MGLFERLFGRKSERPSAQKAESPAAETSEQHKQKPISKEEREEIVHDLAKEMASYISVGEPRNVPDKIPLEETPAFKRLADSELEWKSSPSPNPKILVDYDQLIDKIVAETPHELQPIGNVEPICPYCNVLLPKMPKRSIKCPSCSNEIYLETRPYDEARVLVTKQQSEEVEFQKQIQSGVYQRSIEMLKHHLSGYQESGREGWIFLAVLDERDKPEYVNLHGRVFKFGSPEEVEALKKMAQPGSRCRPKAWFNDSRLDTDPAIYKKGREEWFRAMTFTR